MHGDDAQSGSSTHPTKVRGRGGSPIARSGPRCRVPSVPREALVAVAPERPGGVDAPTARGGLAVVLPDAALVHVDGAAELALLHDLGAALRDPPPRLRHPLELARDVPGAARRRARRRGRRRRDERAVLRAVRRPAERRRGGVSVGARRGAARGAVAAEGVDAGAASVHFPPFWHAGPPLQSSTSSHP